MSADRFGLVTFYGEEAGGHVYSGLLFLELVCYKPDLPSHRCLLSLPSPTSVRRLPL